MNIVLILASAAIIVCVLCGVLSLFREIPEALTP